MPDIHAFLSALRELHPDMAHLGLNGQCFQVYLLLKQVFPDAEPWYDSNHVITKIGDAYYDIRGEVEPVSAVGAQYLRMDPLCFNRAYAWGAPSLKVPESTMEAQQ
ncbi:hypothetical protein D9M68_202520 [compost metagenome]